METVFVISRDGKPVGIERAPEPVGPLAWFHRHHCGSMDNALKHEGYTYTEGDPDCGDVAAILEGIAEREGVTAEFEFVPFSQSRNAKMESATGEPWPSLNWKVRLKRSTRVILETDYSQGVGYAPASKRKHDNSAAMKWAQGEAVKAELETGQIHLFGVTLGGAGPRNTRRPIDPPRLGDVLQSLAQDSRVLDEGPFEEWASSLGYDPDSRKAEAIWKACVEIATTLRGALGGRVLEELQLAAEFN